MSFSIMLNSSKVPGVNPSDFTVSFPAPIPIKAGPGEYWEVGLVGASVWYSWYNIAAGYNNNTLRYSPDGGTTWKNVVIPDGIYQIEQLEAAIQWAMYQNGDFDNTTPAVPRYYVYLIPNYSTLRLRIQLSNNYQVDLSAGLLHELVGFPAAIVATTTEGPNVVDITRGIDSLVIHCSAVRGSYDNSEMSDGIFSFTPTTDPGSLIKLEPINPVYLECSNAGHISSIRMRLTDQLGREINLNGEDVSYHLHFIKKDDVGTGLIAVERMLRKALSGQ